MGFIEKVSRSSLRSTNRVSTIELRSQVKTSTGYGRYSTGEMSERQRDEVEFNETRRG